MKSLHFFTEERIVSIFSFSAIVVLNLAGEVDEVCFEDAYYVMKRKLQNSY